MTRPYRSLVSMSVFVAATVIALSFVRGAIENAYASNPWFNGLILFVLAVGILRSYVQVGSLFREITWIEAYRADSTIATPQVTTRLLAPMAGMLASRTGGQLSLSPLSMRSILDSISDRLAESRDVSRYLVGLLVFLGLLGTFWGLLATINAVGGVIDNMRIDAGDAAAAFASLQNGLSKPLGGMAIAFSSSLFGLAGSLVLGFLDLQAGHGQRRFFQELEEWLSASTRLSSGAGLGDGETPVPVFVEALLEQTADSIDRLQRLLQIQAEERRGIDDQIAALTSEIRTLNQQLTREHRQGLPEDLRQELRLLSRTIGGALDKR